MNLWSTTRSSGIGGVGRRTWPPRQLFTRRPLLIAGLVVLAVVLGIVAGLMVAVLSPLVAAAAIVALGLVFGVLLSAQFGLVGAIGVIFLLPFAVIPVNLGARPALLETVLIGVMVVWLARMMSKGERPVGSALAIWIILFLGLSAFCFLTGTAYGLTTEVIHNYFKWFLSVMLFFSVVNCVRTREQVAQLVQAMILGAAAAAALGIVLYYLPQDTTVQFLSAFHVLGYPSGTDVLRNIAGTETMRATSTSVDPNSYGGALALVIALCAAQLFAKKAVLNRAVIAICTVVMGWALILSYSRGSLLGLVTALVVIASLRYRKLWPLLLAVFAAFYYLPIGSNFSAHLVSGLMVQDQAAAMRLGEIKDAFRLIGQYPWFGVGFSDAPSIDLYLGVSNMYLLIAEEMGVIGLVSFLIIMIVYLVQTIRAVPRLADERLRGVLVGLFGGVIAALAAGMLDHYFFNINFPHMVALLWLFIGLSMATIRIGRSSGDTNSP